MIPEPTIAPYQPAQAAQWDRVVSESECACLLFYRGYMDYHADRFVDASLVARLDGRLVGVFPASAEEDGVHSHGGLTFGGWQFISSLSLKVRQEIHAGTLQHYRNNGYAKLTIRALPRFFLGSSAGDEWCSEGIAEVRTLTGAAVDLSMPERLGAKRRPLRTAKALFSHNFGPTSAGEFWPLLKEVLATRHGVSPVHSLEEMELLQGRFPEQILVFKATREERILAGAILYLSCNVAHIQYMATSLEGRASHALDGLIIWLMRTYAGRLRWLSMGTSNERNGQINQGLLDYKLSFGATPFPHDIQEYDLTK